MNAINDSTRAISNDHLKLILSKTKSQGSLSGITLDIFGTVFKVLCI